MPTVAHGQTSRFLNVKRHTSVHASLANSTTWAQAHGVATAITRPVGNIHGQNIKAFNAWGIPGITPLHQSSHQHMTGTLEDKNAATRGLNSVADWCLLEPYKEPYSLTNTLFNILIAYIRDTISSEVILGKVIRQMWPENRKDNKNCACRPTNSSPCLSKRFHCFSLLSDFINHKNKLDCFNTYWE